MTAGLGLVVSLALGAQSIARAADQPALISTRAWLCIACLGAVLGYGGYSWSTLQAAAPIYAGFTWVRIVQVVGHVGLMIAARHQLSVRPWHASRVRPLLIGCMLSAIAFVADAVLRLAALDTDRSMLMEIVSSVVSALAIVSYGIGTLWSGFEIERELMLNRWRDAQQARSAMSECERLEALGRMAAGVAHDVNNILTVIQTLASMLKMEDGHDDRRLTAATGRILSEVVSCKNWTQRLLVFAKNRLGATEVVSVPACVQSMVPVLHQSLPPETALCVSVGDTTAGGSVEVDKALFEQTVLNLVQNAHEAQHPLEPIVIDIGLETPHTVRQCQVGWMSRRVYVRISVEDRGAGIAMGTMTRMFDPFFTTKGPTRAGLGLYAASRLVAAANGAVEVAPRVGGGTAVTLYLPCVNETFDAVRGVSTEREESAPLMSHWPRRRRARSMAHFALGMLRIGR